MFFGACECAQVSGRLCADGENCENTTQIIIHLTKKRAKKREYYPYCSIRLLNVHDRVEYCVLVCGFTSAVVKALFLHYLGEEKKERNERKL